MNVYLYTAQLEKAGFTADEIWHIYELPFKLTLDVRLSVFQFKINHNILYTKSRLFRDKITENDKCYLCSGVKHWCISLLIVLINILD